MKTQLISFLEVHGQENMSWSEVEWTYSSIRIISIKKPSYIDNPVLLISTHQNLISVF